MTVQELINRLQQLPPNAEVWTRIPDGIEYASDYAINDAVMDEESPVVFLVEGEAKDRRSSADL